MKTDDQTFEFTDPGKLADGELELILVAKILGDPEREWLPTYAFEMRVRGEKVGGLNLRVGNAPFVVMYGGHIGYNVSSEHRGHHYAERACRLLFPLALAHGLTTLWITCNPGNFPSRRTCERLGATMVEIVALPEGCDMYERGEREVCRYRIDLA